MYLVQLVYKWTLSRLCNQLQRMVLCQAVGGAGMLASRGCPPAFSWHGFWITQGCAALHLPSVKMQVGEHFPLQAFVLGGMVH